MSEQQDKIELIYCGKRVGNNKGKILHHFRHKLEDVYYGNRNIPTSRLALGCTYEVESDTGTPYSIHASTFKLIKKDSDEHENLSEWILLDEIASGQQSDKIVANKIKKENHEVIQDMTLREINKMAITMNRTQKNILAAKILGWIL